MNKLDPSIDDVIACLDKYEKRVLRFLGKEHISNHKNIRLETIKKIYLMNMEKMSIKQ